MAVAFGSANQLGLLGTQQPDQEQQNQQHLFLNPNAPPPPILPKPGKDNARLQKLLKRTAKKKVPTAQISQSVALFRSSLSPVNEASADLEHSDHSTPPKTPDLSPYTLYNIQNPPPRFTVRPLYQHVASPYPQRVSTYYGQIAALSQGQGQVQAQGQAQAQGQGVSQLGVPKISLPEATSPSPEPFTGFGETFAGLTPSPGAPVATATAASKGPPQVQPKPVKSTLGPTPFVAPTQTSQTLKRPLTVLTPFGKSKSPRPTFKANERSRSPRPMFDVPQIRMYTATTSYYEASKTPPVYDSAGLTSIGSTASQSGGGTVTLEMKQDLSALGFENVRIATTPTITQPTTTSIALLDAADSQRKTPTFEVKRATPTAEIQRSRSPIIDLRRATPTTELRRAITPTFEPKRATPTVEIKRATPTSDIKRARSPSLETKRAPPTIEIKRATPPTAVTPTFEPKKPTPNIEIQRATPTSDVKPATPTLETKRATPTTETRAKTPTFEVQSSRTVTGRPRTPAYQKARAATPSFEVSRTNPLLFAVSPITVEPETQTTTPTPPIKVASAPNSVAGSFQRVKTPEPKPSEKIQDAGIQLATPPAAAASIAKSKSEPDLTKEQIIAALTGAQRPKTPTYEASRLLTSSPGYKRPRTPTYGASPSPVAFQRPKTPTQVASKSKSTYRGLTPAEYAAYGGIRTYTPAFGIASITTQSEEDVTKVESVEQHKAISQEAPVKEPPIQEVPQVKEAPKVEEKVAVTIPKVPIIIVSQASDTLATSITHEAATVSSQVTIKQEKTVIQETLTKVSKPPEVKPQKVDKPAPEVKPKTKVPEVKIPSVAKSEDQDPLKAVRKLLGRDKVQPAAQKQPATPEVKAEIKKPSPAIVVKPIASEEKVKEKKIEPAPAPEEKKGIEPLAAEPLLKAFQKPKGVKSKLSGWSRLKKHMVVEQEEPEFPTMAPQKAAESAPQSTDVKIVKSEKKEGETQGESQPQTTTDAAPVATKMWDAVLFKMFSTQENIMQQIELNKMEKEKDRGTEQDKSDENKKPGKETEKAKDEEQKEIPSFAFRLPVLLFSPKFDAKRLREAASRPVTKFSTVFEMGLIGRKGKEEEPKDFNRKARGFITS